MKNKIQTKGVCKLGVGFAAQGIPNAVALAALLRSGGGPMKDKRKGRGGARNRQRDILAEV